MDDVQAYLDKAVAAGGKASMPLAEIPGVVAVAIFSDQTGAAIGLQLAE